MLADDLLVGNDGWRMISLGVEPDRSAMMSVVPSAASASPCAGRGVLGGTRGIDARPWTSTGAGSRCVCASGRAVSSATNPIARSLSGLGA